MTISNNLIRQYEMYSQEYEKKVLEVLRSGNYILGNEVKMFEKEWADYIGTDYCVGVASGLDALWIGLRLLGIKSGDEVIVCSNAYIASVMGITIVGGSPVFVEPDQYDNIDENKIECAITPRTKAILAVHLYGQPCNMTKIVDIANRYHLKVVEDCAQSHGAKWLGKNVGSYGDIGCFSFYPTKVCGGFGDAGCITTNSDVLANQIRIFRNYGSKNKYQNVCVGANSRLDELQAGLLRVKLSHLDELIQDRKAIANRYLNGIKNDLIGLPCIRKEAFQVWHQFVIHVGNNERDNLKAYLESYGIITLIHYPIPPHLSEAYAYLGRKSGDYPIAEQYANEILSLPIYNGMTESEQNYIIRYLNEFCGGECIERKKTNT